MSTSQFVAESIQSKEEIKSLVTVRPGHKDTEDKILDMIVPSGALLKGHFELESKQHSSLLFRFNSVAGNRDYVECVADSLIADLKNDRVGVDVVLVQESAGRVLGETIAAKLGKRRVTVRTDEHNRPTMSLINETMLYRGDKVLVVSDLATTGSGLTTMMEVVRQKKARPVAVALFAVRNRGEISTFELDQHIKVYALADLALEQVTYGRRGIEPSVAECELCRAGKPRIASWEI